jgi:hypothetical protein
VLKPIRFDWFQAGDVLPIDCTGFSCAVTETTLPWVPAVALLNAPLSQWQIAAPTAPQAALLVTGQRYGIKIVLFNALGEAIEGPADLTVVAVA